MIQPSNARQSSKKQKRQEEVLDAATEVFWRRGYANASIQDVAEHLGILKGSLYHYINSKEDLLRRICINSHEGCLGILDSVKLSDGSAIERLKRYIEEYTNYYLTNIERVGLYLRESHFLSKENYAVIVEQRRLYDSFVIELIEDAQSEGQANRELNSKYCAYYILGAINGLPDWYKRGGKESARAISRIYAEQSIALIRV